MTYQETAIVPVIENPARVEWGPAIAGAVVAAALAFVLHTFAGAIGLAVSSTAPTWRDASIGLWVLSGVYLILVALASYGFGGYVAGRFSTLDAEAGSKDEIELRAGLHGLLVWGLATLLTAFLIFASAGALTRLAAASASATAPSASVGGENIIAYDLDRLFRSDRRLESDDITYSRAEAARILLTASGHSGVSADDRGYLVRLVSARTGLQAADAERRVDVAIAAARDDIRRARKSMVILAFMAGAAALLGSAAAWFGAGAGARERNEGTASFFLRSVRRTS